MTSRASRQKLNNMLSEFKPTEKANKKKNIFDDYLLILMNLPNTKRFQEFFDPLRLRMFLIKPSEDILYGRVPVANNPQNHFFHGCKFYLKGNFEQAVSTF